jgi:hypothetical protein
VIREDLAAPNERGFSTGVEVIRNQVIAVRVTLLGLVLCDSCFLTGERRSKIVHLLPEMGRRTINSANYSGLCKIYFEPCLNEAEWNVMVVKQDSLSIR